MKRDSTAIGGALALAAVSLAPYALRAETLADAVALAYQSNPTLQAQRATLRETDETYVQARAGYMPTASVQGTVTTDNNTEISNVNGTRGVGIDQSSSAVLTVTQPLYTGGRVASAVDTAVASVQAGRQALRATEQSVLQSVIQAYVGVRCDQQNLAIAREQVVQLQGELAEIQARHKVGEITLTDLAQTQARVASARAQLATAEATLGVDRAAYAQVVGQPPGELAPEPSLDRFLPRTADEAAVLAIADNPQLRQASYTERASAGRLAAAKAETRPTLSLQGSAGYAGSNLGYNTPFANYGHDYSATAVATLPLFTGGLVSSQIRQAAEANNVDREGVESARRAALFAVSQSWRQLSGLRETLKDDEEAAAAARIAFEGSSKEGKLGLRDTLEVLIAEQDLYAAEVALADARRDEYIAASGLLAAVGALDASHLSPTVAPYDPKANFDRVRRKQFWTPWEPVVEVADRIGAPASPPPPGALTSGPTSLHDR
jgi:outer membrane protein